MRRIVISLVAVAFTAAVVGVAVAGDPPVSTHASSSVTLRHEVRLPPIRLPDTKALTRALLRAERPSVQKQLVASRRVVAFFDNPDHRWLRAPAKAKCWEVPWQRTCTIARATYRLHTTLAVAGERRLWRELPTPADWVTSVRVIQRVFPGTERWLLSCSSAEGGHGRFVIFGGGSYYPGAEHSYNGRLPQVGGPMQYMWGTFRGHYRHGLDALRARGFQISLPSPTDVRAWLSPTAQAVAAGWARWSGNDNSHWEASFGRGCS